MCLHTPICHNLQNSLFPLTGSRHDPLFLLAKNIFHSQLHSHLPLPNPSPGAGFPLPLPEGSLSSRPGVPAPVASSCSFRGPFAGPAIGRVQTDKRFPFLLQHTSSWQAMLWLCRARVQTYPIFRMPHTHLLSVNANTSFNTELTQIIVLSLQKCCKVLRLLPKLPCIWMFWFQYYSAHGFSCFENRKFTCPTGSPLVPRVSPLLFDSDTTSIDVIKKFPQVKATGMGVHVASYFNIVCEPCCGLVLLSKNISQ